MASYGPRGGRVSLTAVSLFAGVGGFDLAMQRNGIDVVATVEIDKAARGVLQYHFPQAQHFTDVTEVTGEQLRAAGFVPERGILTGGFPCQDLSVAGRRAGLGGERSGLFWEIMRLADELRPKYLVLENVPGLLSSNAGRDFGTVLGAMAERGYGFAYRILDSQYFGVAQRRRRVFIVGCLGDDGTTPGEILALREGVSGHSAPRRTSGSVITNALTTGLGSGGPDDNEAQAGHIIARTLTARHDSSPDGDRGFNIVPMLLTMREGKDGGGKGPLVSEDVSLTLATGNGQVLIQPTPFVKIIRSGARDENGDLPPEVWAEREVAPTLNIMDNTGESRATVLAFSHNNAAHNGTSETTFPTLKAQHQGGGPAVAETLRSHPRPGSNSLGSMTQDGSTVRRLTPTECERLQGFPDSWTKYRLNDKGEVVEQADSARYKQCGNAVTVSVVEWIMKRLLTVAYLPSNTPQEEL